MSLRLKRNTPKFKYILSLKLDTLFTLINLFTSKWGCKEANWRFTILSFANLVWADKYLLQTVRSKSFLYKQLKPNTKLRRKLSVFKLLFLRSFCVLCQTNCVILTIVCTGIFKLWDG